MPRAIGQADRVGAVPAQRVEQHDGLLGGRRCRSGRPASWRRRGHLVGLAGQRLVHAAGLFVEFADRRAGQDVVELHEQQVFPEAVEGGLVELVAALPASDAEPLEVVQADLVLAVGPLDPGLGGVGAAVEFEVELAVPDGQGRGLGLDLLDEVADLAVAELRQPGGRRVVRQPLAGLEHQFRRPAAAVAPAEREQALARDALLLVLLPVALEFLDVEHAVVGEEPIAAAGGGDELHRDLAAVEAAPAERVVREAVELVPGDLAGDERVAVRQLQQLRQGGRVAEHVGQPQVPAVDAELLGEVLLAVEELADERLAAGDVHVAFAPGGAFGLPAAGLDELLDLGQQVRGVLLQPLVGLRAGLLEDPVGVLLQQADLRGERADELVVRHADRPEPAQVDVGVAHRQDLAAARRGRWICLRILSNAFWAPATLA